MLHGELEDRPKACNPWLTTGFVLRAVKIPIRVMKSTKVKPGHILSLRQHNKSGMQRWFTVGGMGGGGGGVVAGDFEFQNKFRISKFRISKFRISKFRISKFFGFLNFEFQNFANFNVNHFQHSVLCTSYERVMVTDRISKFRISKFRISKFRISKFFKFQNFSNAPALGLRTGTWSISKPWNSTTPF